MPIIPAAISQVSACAGGWRVAREFGSLIDCTEALMRVIPRFEYLVCDLSAYPDEELRAGG